mmetsp:Transcript_88694/g.237183  ORF Transcript_88694/g.237183 Transcript_88694/m.237183 type:complete len:870 (-) Transcript_88694:190-2799(-)
MSDVPPRKGWQLCGAGLCCFTGVLKRARPAGAVEVSPQRVMDASTISSQLVAAATSEYLDSDEEAQFVDSESSPCHRSPKASAICRTLTGSVTRIALTEERGISLKQLRGVLQHIKENAESWIDTHRGTSADPNANYGKPLKWKEVNLYQAMEHFLKPVTEEAQCSYVELVAVGSQVPRWFCSHWWGEPVSDFVECIATHAELRMLQDSSPYWVCAYANNQWDLGSEIASDPAKSSFRRAIDLSDGTLSIVDRGAIVFSRIWCGFEVATTIVYGETKLYDIATVHPDSGRGVVITDGVSAADFDEAKGRVDLAHEIKSRRESLFPMQLTKRALDIRIEKAEASMEQDKVRILNRIATSSSLDEVPPVDCEEYQRVNRSLHGIFATAAFRQALEAGAVESLNLPAILRRSGINRVGMSFAGCRAMNEQNLKIFCGCWPLGLEVVKLDFTANTIVSFGALGEALGVQLGLKSLRLAFTGSKQLADSTALLAGVGNLQDLDTFTLRFTNCKDLVRAGSRGALKNLKKLDVLTCSFAKCRSLEVCALEESLEFMAGLTKLRLDFSGCIALADFGFFRSIAGMGRLQSLELKCNNSAKGVGFKETVECIANHPVLSTIELQFSNCDEIVDVDILGASLRTLPAAENLTFDFSNCRFLQSVAGIAEALGTMKKLEQLSVNCHNCPKLRVTGTPQRAVMESVQKYSLVLSSCKALLGVDGFGVAAMPNARSVSLVLTGCRQVRSVDCITQALSSCRDLSTLDLQLTNTKISSIGPTAAALQGLPLRKLAVACAGCSDLTETEPLGSLLASFPLRELYMTFGGSKALTDLPGLLAGLKQVSRGAPVHKISLTFKGLEVPADWELVRTWEELEVACAQ